jgi:hypothetical protein
MKFRPQSDMAPFGQMVVYGKNWNPVKERLVAQRLRKTVRRSLRNPVVIDSFS